MRNVLWALTWEYWKSGRLGFAGALGVMVGIPGLLYGLSTLYGTEKYLKDATPLLILAFASVVVMVSLFAVLRVQAGEHMSFPSRFYTLPVPTNLFVAWKLTISAVTAALLFLLCAACLNTLFDAGWPYGGPALLLATIVTCAQAANWTTSHNRTLQTSVACVLIVVVGYLLWMQFDDDSTPFGYSFWSLAAVQLLLLLPACAIARWAVVASRRGDSLLLPAGRRRSDRRTLQLQPPRIQLSPTVALLWSEWRQKGWWMPLTALAAIGAMVVTHTFSGMKLQTLINSLISFPLTLIPLMAPLFALSIARVQPDGKIAFGRFDSFRATRPISDTSLARAILMNGATSLVSTYLMAVLGLAVTVFALHRFGDATLVEHELSQQFGPASIENLRRNLVVWIMSLGIAWTLSSIMICLLLTGRVWLTATVVGVFIASIVLLLGGLQSVSNQSVIRALLGGWMHGLGIVSWCFTTWAFVAATRKRLLSFWIALAAAVLWIVATRLTISNAWPAVSGELPLAYAFSLCGLWALPLLPFAAGPLAVSWNRHR